MTRKLTKGERANLNTLIAAAKAGDLALISGRINATGEEVAIIAAISRDGDQFCVVPFGHLCPDNPYEYYADPTVE